ncbi:hypothetical protein DL766_003013 [Monosporascus sp. MC13-8B]|uniref:Uncharacterized protein n=1 Tax=Monosporascus cannonballus TaxID=155416 RepID=A0ABY0H713_9PEZI|nr:hypothetical protein DL762_004734 [Monosporascus cannonballus]RYO98785.1 hypothetical protein DL763_002046 [Monosporascus cannonballus]RYP34364.1 hypothetical protein DL766_003013 [Monosporascus sp. MC13-8B]
MIPLKSMYEGEWPIKNQPVKGAKQYSWSNIGPAEGTVDGGTVDRIEEHNRLIETLKVRYSNCRVAKGFKRATTSAIGAAPALGVEQRVAARFILVRAGQNGGRTRVSEVPYEERREEGNGVIGDFSSRQPIPFPDMAQHGLHWIDWLVKNPKLDFRRPEKNPRPAKSVVYHFGARCCSGDPNGKDGIRLTKDSARRLHEDGALDIRLMPKLDHSAFGASTEIIQHLFGLLDPDLLADYVKVATEVGKSTRIPFETRCQDEPFVLRALLINPMTHENKDGGDLHYGLAGLVMLGDFRGGALLLRELGLPIQSAPGAVQLIRGRGVRSSN